MVNINTILTTTKAHKCFIIMPATKNIFMIYLFKQEI
jgi:hypothetical protein